MPSSRRLFPLAAAGVVLLSGCGTTGRSADRSTRPHCTPVTAHGSTTPREAKHSSDLTYLTDVRVDSQECLDRIEFAFRESAGTPGYRVAYVPADTALVEDGSGAPIALRGNAYLVVRLEPAATADISGEELVRTYTGPRRLAPPENAHFVREVVKSGDFEAVVSWVIGVDGRRPFTTRVSDARLIVTIG